MNLNELQEIMKASLDSYGQGYFGEDDMPEGMELVEEGDWTQEHKYQYSTDIYGDGEGNFYAVHNSRSGSYHTDWYYGAPSVNAVKKTEKVIRVTEWVAV